jgi:hypothetical protein
MLPTVEELISLNEKAKRVLNGSLQRLRDSLPGEDADEEADIIAEMDLISGELSLIRNKLIHLRAAEVVVQPMSAETQQSLDDLAAALDRAIMRQAWLDASIDIIQELFDTASEVREITADHT